MPRLPVVNVARGARRVSHSTISARPRLRRRLVIAAGGGVLVSCACGVDSRARCVEGPSGAAEAAAVMAAPMLAAVGAAAYVFGGRGDDSKGGGCKGSGGSGHESSPLVVEEPEQEQLAADELQKKRTEAEPVESERLAADELQREQFAAENCESDRLAAEKLQKEQVAAEKAESERLEAKEPQKKWTDAEKPQHDRLSGENAECEASKLVGNLTSEPELSLGSERPANNSGSSSVPENRVPRATPKRRRKVRSTFTEADVRDLMQEFDVNRDGRIDKDELQDLAFSLGLALDEQDAQTCLRALDTDGDGSLDEHELAQWLVQQDGDGGKRVSGAPYVLRARLMARHYGRVLTRQANAMTARLLLGDEADEALAEAEIQQAQRDKGGRADGTVKSLEESERIRRCLDEVPLLDALSRSKKERLVRAFRSRHYKAGEEIITQGHVGDAFFILQRGACRVFKSDTVESDGSVKELRVLRAGAHFGELALKNNAVRAATVEAIENSLVLELKASDFQTIIGPLLHIINFTEWATAPSVVSGQSGGASAGKRKPGPKATRAPSKGHGDVFSAGSPLEVFRNRKVAEYEARLRRLSNPGKVFAYFASVETQDGEQMMVGTDFLAALGVLHPHVIAGQQDEINTAGKRFTMMFMPEGKAKGKSSGLLISYAEFRFFRSLLSIRPVDLEMAFQIFDRDEDGVINSDEFVNMFSALSGRTAEDAPEIPTAVFDKLKQWLNSEGHRGPIRQVSHSDRSIQSTVTSGDGVSFREFWIWLTTLQSELVRLEFLNWATDSSGDGKVDSLSASDFGRMIVHLLSSTGHDVRGHRQRRAAMPDKLATARVDLADFAHFSAVLTQLEQVEAAVGLATSGGTGLVDRATFERGIDAAFGSQLALPTTIIDVIFIVLDADGDGKLSTDELFGALRERRRATNGAAIDRHSFVSCCSECVSGR